MLIPKQLTNICILMKEQSQNFKVLVTESDFLNVLKSMLNNKSPGNNGLTKAFYETFWEEI